ncbi:MAG: Mechanosensitive ion channel family protein [Oscillospiraceae bacterium]|jgi:MscS family membrane protein
MQNLIENLWHTSWFSGFVLPLAVFLLFYLLRGTVVSLLFKFAHRLDNFNKKSEWSGELEQSFQKPLRILITAAGVYAALRISAMVPHSGSAWLVTVKCFRSLFILLMAWGFGNLCGSRKLTGSVLLKKLDINTDGVLFPFLSKTLRFLILCLAILIVAQEWDYSISGLLAGLGLGGLAFALAAQDMLSNLFGGLVIFLDRPFVIGDWIQTDSTEGTVEDINFRSVKVRTFSQAVVTIPNSKLVDRPVTNFSRMGKRRVTFTIGLKYGTTEHQIRSCKNRIRQMLLENENVDPETIIVVFNSIGESSLDLMLYFFTKTTNWQKYLEVREDIYYNILRIIEEEHAEIAFPTRTIQLEKEV